MLYILENTIPHVLNKDVDNKKKDWLSMSYWWQWTSYMCDVSHHVTWTLNTTWEYRYPYNNYASQKLFDAANALRGMRPLRNCYAVRWQRISRWTPKCWGRLAILRY
jgi:hypothetical protein